MRPLARPAVVALLAVVAVVAVTTLLDEGSAREPGPRALQVRDGRIVNGAGDGVRMRGFNIIPVWIGMPGQTWGPAEYRRIKRGGFDTVRMMLYWHLLEPKRGRLHRGYLRSLDTAVRHAGDAGLKIVLNEIGLFQGQRFVPPWAHGADTLASVERNARGYVRAIAKRYADEPAVVAHDPVNEPPTYPPDQNRILRMYRVLFDTIREVAPHTLLMFEPSWGDSAMHGADLTLLGDRRNVVFTMHDYYAGGAGVGYGANGERTPPEQGARIVGLGSQSDATPSAEEMEEHLRVNLDVMRAERIPVWIGEFGVELDLPQAGRLVREKVALYRRHGLGHAWWLYHHVGRMAAVENGRFKPFVRALRR